MPFAAQRALALFLIVTPAMGLALASPASAQVPQTAPQTLSLVDAAKLLLQNGKLSEAQKALEAAKPLSVQDKNEVDFLLGMIALQGHKPKIAIHFFRRILVRTPSAVRVRLELGRAFLEDKDLDNAERQFRLARAGDLPAAAKTNIDAYLVAIRQSRQFNYSLSAAVEPDTNINAGPRSTSVTLYGLPFALSPGATEKSGVGYATDATFDYSPGQGPGLRLRTGGDVDAVVYPDHHFNDVSTGLYAGPRYVAGRWEASLLAVGYERWYGDQFYNRGLGVSAPAEYSLTPKIGVTGALSILQSTFSAASQQSGAAVSGGLGLIAILDTQSQAGVGLSVSHQGAKNSGYAYTASQLSFSYTRDLPGGFTFSASPAFLTIDYDAALAAFGVTRRDDQWRLSTSLLNRRIDLYGFTPRLTYTYTQNHSDISLYSYVRNQFEVGLTRAF